MPDQMAEWEKVHGRPPRILFLVESSNGFGHFNIVSQISTEARKFGTEVAIASGTLARRNAPTGGMVDGIKCYNLPPVVSQWSKETGSIPVNPENGKLYNEDVEHQKERQKAITDAARDFCPDIIVSEIYPFIRPFMDVDLGALKALYANDPVISPAFICLARDIIHNRSTAQHSVNTLNEQFDHIIVRGDPHFKKLEDCQPEWENITLPFEYMGNVLRKMPAKDSRPDEERPVMVSPGGGYHEDEATLFSRVIEARNYSERLRTNPWKLVVSNKCPDDIFAKLKQKAEEASPDGKIIVTRPYDSGEFSNDIANCSAAISRCGYNATFELASSGRPFVVIPRTSYEQMMRADALEAAGFAKKILPDELNGDAQKVAQKIAQALDDACMPKETPPLMLDYDGASRAASRLTELAYIQREKILQDIFETKIKPALFAQAQKSDRPVALILGGAPGAGKSTMAQAAIEELNAQGIAPVHITGEAFYRYHPDYERLMHEDDKTARPQINAEIGRWINMAISYAKEQHIDLILEMTMRDYDRTAKELTDLRDKGYEIDARIVAVDPCISRAGILRRYEEEKAEKGIGHWTAPWVHQQACDGLPSTIEKIEAAHLVDKLMICNRDREPLYHNPPSDETILQPENGRVALEKECDRPLAPEEFLDLMENFSRIAVLMLNPERNATIEEMKTLHDQWKAAAHEGTRHNSEIMGSMRHSVTVMQRRLESAFAEHTR
jgi:predicted glycosyltransferase/predicted ABC-type ATPase